MAQGTPSKQTKGNDTPQATTSHCRLQSKDQSELTPEHKKKTTQVHPSENQTENTVCEDPSVEQDAVSWYSDSAGRGEYDTFGKSPDTGGHPWQTTHMGHTHETTYKGHTLETTHVDHTLEATHMDHPLGTTPIDHQPQTTHADNLSKWATDA